MCSCAKATLPTYSSVVWCVCVAGQTFLHTHTWGPLWGGVFSSDVYHPYAPSEGGRLVVEEEEERPGGEGKFPVGDLGGKDDLPYHHSYSGREEEEMPGWLAGSQTPTHTHTPSPVSCILILFIHFISHGRRRRKEEEIPPCLSLMVTCFLCCVCGVAL